MKTYLLIIVTLFIGLPGKLHAQQTIPLSDESELKAPYMTLYRPAVPSPKGSSILIIPGGAYSFLAIEEEGHVIARAFASRGITAFVLNYRLPANIHSAEKPKVGLKDAQLSLQTIRKNAIRWKIDSSRVGAIGYSAGGHLAATLATHPGPHPDFLALIYTVISMKTGLTHMGTRINLLGENPGDSLIHRFSMEEQVSPLTPPTYLTHAADDSLVSVQNSIAFYQALLKNKVPAEIHLFPKGDHGFIQRLPISEFIDPILLWMKKNGF